MRPTTARIHLDALRHNLAVLKATAARSRVWAVVKANAYGHGLQRAAPALQAADGLALLELDAGLALREAGEQRPILLLEGFFSSQELPVIAAQRFAVVVHSLEQVAMLERARLETTIPVYLKANTGMNRLGLEDKDFATALERLERSGNVGPVTLMTHFADAEGRGIDEQLQRFNRMAAGRDLPRSLANSAALLRFPETHADWVRPGLALYGSSPFPERSAEALGLRPAMTLASELIAVRELRAGESIGYGWTFTAPTPMRVGVVACGYADGYPRHAPTGTPILVAGKRTRTVGRVSMDMLFADLSGIANAGVGSPVILWGERVSVDEVAASAGTVSYELLCRLGQRVPVVELDPSHGAADRARGGQA